MGNKNLSNDYFDWNHDYHGTFLLGNGVFTPLSVRQKECHCHSDGINISNVSNIH